MKETIIILGAGVMQGPAINIAKELGFFTIALDGSSSAPCVSQADQFEQIDLKDKEGIETFARSILGKTNRLGIMTAGTDFSASVAWTAEKLGLPGIPYEAALNASDKSRMRECFKKASLPSPDFFVVSKEEFNHGGHGGHGGGNFIDTNILSFPAVIKPVDNMGSRGCRRVDSMKEFHEAAKTAINFSRSGRAIVENYMDGPEFSVDAIVYHGEITICGLADRHIFFPPYFIEMGHTMPTVIETKHSDAILEVFCAGIRALGLAENENIGAAKGDIKLTAKGPMIGEIAARLSGGYMSGWTYPYSSGALPIKAAILAAMGKTPEGLIPLKKWTCAERAFISIPGTVKQIVGGEILAETQSKKEETGFINNLFMRIKEGDKVSFPENNVTKCGNIIASAPDRETAVKSAENAARSILIRLDPSDTRTDAFLCANTVFPPDAFQLTDELREDLAQLPATFREKEETAKDTELHGVFGTSASFPSVNPVYSVVKFPAFESSGLTDYMGRTVKETLDAVRLLTGLSLPIRETSLQADPENAENEIRLGRSFWTALIRGSYQGAVYYIDNLRR
ncbi:MAG: ATP-grasp domain-containing protein [Treponema sp.]|nr:ATP-grasp domain-containing protein [Treponema sp.]